MTKRPARSQLMGRLGGRRSSFKMVGGGPDPFGELLLNGNFGDASVWTQNAATWVLANGVATGTLVTVTDDLVQTVTLKVGATYRVVYQLVSLSAGAISWKLSNGQVGGINSTLGNASEIFTVTSAVTDFRMVRRGTDFSGVIDNVSLIQVG